MTINEKETDNNWKCYFPSGFLCLNSGIYSTADAFK